MSRIQPEYISDPMTDTLSKTAEKACTKCKVVQPLGDYSASKLTSDGKQSWCRSCSRQEARERYSKDPANKRAYNSAWSAANKEKRASISAAWRKNNPEKARAVVRAYELANPSKGYARCGTRRATKQNATPQWADRFIIQEIYDLAKRRTKATGFAWHVDHIVPLKSKIVCGLHCEANMQVIPGVLNMSKGNTF